MFHSAFAPLAMNFSGFRVHLFFRDRDQRLHYLLESLERGMEAGLGVLCHVPTLSLVPSDLEPPAYERRDPAEARHLAKAAAVALPVNSL
jgi:hypothetical protein